MKQETPVAVALDQWWHTPSGYYLSAWEQAQFDAIVPNVFGYYALQLGMPQLDALAHNRMPHRWLGLTLMDDAAHLSASHTTHTGKQGIFVVDSTALPFQNDCLDLIVLPHTLELSSDAHATLREVARVLRPEGRLVIVGLNPLSLWTLKRLQTQFLSRFSRIWPRTSSEIQFQKFPNEGHFLSHWRLLDWLQLLDFEIEKLHLGIYQPAMSSAAWLERSEWMNRLGHRWWPMFGAVYLVVATKKVHGMRLLGPAWRNSLPTKTVAPSASWMKP
jgi:SAM-dependent methyltransferase